MPIAKFLLATVISAAPIGLLSAQSTAPADSGQDGHHVREWLAGTGAAAGAGLFLAFTHSDNSTSGTHSDPSFHAPANTPADQPAVAPTGGSTPPPSHTDTPTPPTDTGTVSPPDAPVNAPVVNDANPPHTNAPVGPTDDPPPEENPLLPPDASTVPEPGSAALLATGIVGLVPLLRKRRK